MTLSGFEAYVRFMAMKRHFTPGSGYDFHKYHGKVNVKQSTYEAMGAKCFIFEKLGRHRDTDRLMVSVFSHNPKAWIGDMFGPEAEERHNRFVKITEALTYHTKQQLSQFEPWMSFNDIMTFQAEGGNYPPVLEAILDGSFSPEVMCVLDELVNGSIIRHWEKTAGWDPVVKVEVERVKNLRGFIEYDAEVLKATVKKVFENLKKEDRPA